jgi:hypothetical protein
MTARSLEQVLADVRGELPILRKHKQDALADALERLCKDVANAAEEYLLFVSETDAQLRTGRSLRWLRARFPEWERAGHGRWRSGHRQYRLLILPQRANPQAAYEAGKAAGRERVA